MGRRRHPQTDAAVLPVLMKVMGAAGRHDRDEALRLLDEAECFLGEGFHQAREGIARARDSARAGEWRAVYRHAYGATCGLTWAFPPSPLVCPPPPEEHPFAAATGCACGVDLPVSARFCAMCGTARPTIEP